MVFLPPRLVAARVEAARGFRFAVVLRLAAI